MDPKPSTAHGAAHQIVPHRDGDVVVLEAKDWTGAEEALSKLAHAALNRRRAAAGSDFSAGPRVSEPPRDSTLGAADLRIDPLAADQPPRGTSRGHARLLAAACVGIAVTLAWQAYGGPARQMIASAVPQLGWLVSPPAMDARSAHDSAVEPPSPMVIQASPPQEASTQAVAPAASPAAALAVPAAISPELQQQLDAMAHDLAALRQSVEQLTAGQEQMARDIAKVHAPAPDVRRRVSALPPPATAPVPAAPRRPVPPPEPAAQSLTPPLLPPPPEPAPQASTTAPLPAAPEPPRPPMPVR